MRFITVLPRGIKLSTLHESITPSPAPCSTRTVFEYGTLASSLHEYCTLASAVHEYYALAISLHEYNTLTSTLH